MSRRTWIAALTLVVLGAWALRVALGAAFQGLDTKPDPALGLDHIEYEWLARNMHWGQPYQIYDFIGPSAFRPPGTPWLILGIYEVFGRDFAAVRVVFSLLGALTCLALAGIARTLGASRGWALFAALALALYPGHAYYSMHFFSETPWTFFLTLSIWMGVLWIQRGRWWAVILQGLLLGYATHIRPVAFLLPFLQWGGLAIATRFRPATLLRATVVCALCVASLVPWAARNQRVMGEWIWFTTHGGTTLYGAHNGVVWHTPELRGRWISPEKTPGYDQIRAADGEIAKDDVARELGLEWIRQNWRRMPELTLHKLRRTFDPHPRTPNQAFNLAIGLAYAFTLPFAILGLWRLTRRMPRENIPPLASLGMVVAITLLFYGDHRFRLSIAPTWILWATHGLQSVLHARNPGGSGLASAAERHREEA